MARINRADRLAILPYTACHGQTAATGCAGPAGGIIFPVGGLGFSSEAGGRTRMPSTRAAARGGENASAVRIEPIDFKIGVSLGIWMYLRVAANLPTWISLGFRQPPYGNRSPDWEQSAAERSQVRVRAAGQSDAEPSRLENRQTPAHGRPARPAGPCLSVLLWLNCPFPVSVGPGLNVCFRRALMQLLICISSRRDRNTLYPPIPPSRRAKAVCACAACEFRIACPQRRNSRASRRAGCAGRADVQREPLDSDAGGVRLRVRVCKARVCLHTHVRRLGRILGHATEPGEPHATAYSHQPVCTYACTRAAPEHTGSGTLS
jgi:hypothetical protein